MAADGQRIRVGGAAFGRGAAPVPHVVQAGGSGAGVAGGRAGRRRRRRRWCAPTRRRWAGSRGRR